MGSKDEDLPIGTRVLKIDYDPKSLICRFENGDGPFQTLKELRKNSLLFKTLLVDNPQRAQKIFDDRFLIKLKSMIFLPKEIDEQLNGKLFHMLAHTISGDIGKNNVSGIHFFEPEFHRIIEVTKQKNEKGIWEAKIEAIRPTKNDWIKKDRPSTFFPTDWTKELLVLKLHHAFQNKIESSDIASNGERNFIGKTDCGIKIVFRINGDEEIISVYPKYE